jgi:choice-of-anchor B domain-containing protein
VSLNARMPNLMLSYLHTKLSHMKSVFKTFLFLLLLLATTGLQAQTHPQASNMVMLGNWDVDTIPRYSDVWGYARDGREYALIGSRDYFHIIDVTDPSSPTEIIALNSFENSSSTWRDIKVLGDYAYCVTETNEGLQVIDLTMLPDTAIIVFQDDTDFTRCHNIIIDDTSTPPRLYAFGARPGAQLNGYLTYSLADPTNPVLVATVDIDNPDDPNVGYIHDGYARNDTLYANHGGSGMYVYDVADAQNPVEIGSLVGYEQSGYNHSIWPTDDGQHLVMCDETTNKGVKVISVDKSDPFGLDIQVESIFRSKLLAPDTASLAHNPYVLGDSLVVLSYYGDGIQVWDIRDANNPFRVGYYDTTPNGGSYGGGIWGAYPYLPSGNILGSDISNGLFIVQLLDLNTLPVEYGHWTATTNGKDALLSWSTTDETANAGWQVEHAAENGTFVAVGFVDAAAAGDYSFSHNNPGTGLHYYRLRQMDLDGTETVNELRSIVISGGAEGVLALYPNPAPAAAPISITGLSAGESWELHTVDGRFVRSGTGNQALKNVQSGAYVVRGGERAIKLLVH